MTIEKNYCIPSQLLEALNENISLQRENLCYEVTTMVDYSAFIDDTLAIPREHELNIKQDRDNFITSILFSSKGDEMIPSIHTNVPHLIVLFQLDEEEKKILSTLPIASRFRQFEEDGKIRFYTDCYDDVNLAASLFSEMLQIVVGTSYDALSSYITTKVDFRTKQEEQKRLKKLVRRQFASLNAYYKLSNDNKQLEKIEKKVTNYNASAEKYGYLSLILNRANMTLTGSFIPKEETSDMSYFAKVKLAGRNGWIEDDFLSLCKSVGGK